MTAKKEPKQFKFLDPPWVKPLPIKAVVTGRRGAEPKAKKLRPIVLDVESLLKDQRSIKAFGSGWQLCSCKIDDDRQGDRMVLEFAAITRRKP